MQRQQYIQQPQQGQSHHNNQNNQQYHQPSQQHTNQQYQQSNQQVQYGMQAQHQQQAQMALQAQQQQQQQQMMMQQQMQQQQQMLQQMMTAQYSQNNSQNTQLQGSAPANNQLLQQFQNMQQAGYHNQLQQVISQNQILSNPLIISNRERLLTQMRNEQEHETIRRAQQSVNNKEITATDLMRIITLRPIELPKKGAKEDEQAAKIRNRDVHIQYDFVNSSWDVEGKKYEQSRTNQPYKIIINREENREDPKRMLEKERMWQTTKDDNYRPNFRDLIVHTVTDADKDGVIEEHDRENYMRKELDDENRVIYSSSNQTKHKKQFEYKHIYKYRIKIDSKNHIELKDDRVAYYEDQQRKIESDRAQSDALLSMMQANDMIDQEMLEAGLEKPDEDGNNVDEEVDALMNRLGLAPRKSKKRSTAEVKEISIASIAPVQTPATSSTSLSSSSSRFVTSSRAHEKPENHINDTDKKNDDVMVINFSSRRKAK